MSKSTLTKQDIELISIKLNTLYDNVKKLDQFNTNLLVNVRVSGIARVGNLELIIMFRGNNRIVLEETTFTAFTF